MSQAAENHIPSVLFVDDDADEFYLFNEAIEQSSIQAKMTRAKDGNDLLQQLSSSPLPDIIFMDLNMPYKDGIEALTELRSDDRYNHIPVIIFSTSNNPDHINTCYQNGASLYAVKPETFDDIAKVVRKVFSIDWSKKVSPSSEKEFLMKY